MTDKHGDPRFYKLLDEIADLHSRKNHDYAKTEEPLSNFHRSTALGVEPWRGVLVRMSDKWSRIEQLAGGKIAKNESLRDSLVDLAVYALIDVLLMEDAALLGLDRERLPSAGLGTSGDDGAPAPVLGSEIVPVVGAESYAFTVDPAAKLGWPRE